MKNLAMALAISAALATAACQQGQEDTVATTPETTTPGSAPTTDMPSTAPGGVAGPATPGATAENRTQAFATAVAMNDMLEMESSRLALQRSKNEAVRKHASQMIDEHTRTTKELQGLAKSATITLPTSMDGAGQQIVTNLRNASDADFDRAYLDMQVQAHQAAVREFETYSQNGDNADMKAWAAKTLPTLRTHLQNAEQLRTASRT